MTIVSQKVHDNNSHTAISGGPGGYSVHHSAGYLHRSQDLIELGMWLTNQGHRLKRVENKANSQNYVMKNKK